MSQEDRIVQIYELLKEKHSLTYHDLMDQFGISRDTARRDIVKLVNMGYAVRTHGGLMLNTKDSIIIDYQECINVNADIKQALAAQAVTYINEERKVIFFDASTSVNEVCRLVNENVIAYCANMPSIEVLASHCEAHLMGGIYDPLRRYMVGAELNHQLEYLHFDLAFIGAGAVQDDGVYYDNSEEAYTKHLIASRSAYVCVIYDDSKYDKNGSVKGLSFDEINVIVTNKNPPEEILNAIERSGCDLDIVEMTE